MEPQRCVWHIWRSLSGDLGRAVSQAVQGVSKAAAETGQAEAAETALQQLLAHPQGKAWAAGNGCNGYPRAVLARRRLRLSHGRNHRSEQRLERAALLWAIYHSFEPAQWRSEHQRHYRHPGKVPSKWPVCRPDKSVIWMLWASEQVAAHG